MHLNKTLILLAAMLLSSTAAADNAISTLPQATTLSGTELLPVVQNGSTKAATVNQLSAGAASSVQTLTNKTLDGGSNTFTNLPASQLVGSLNIASLVGTLGVSNGGTNLSSGTGGGLLYFSDASTLASSSALTANALVLGGGAGGIPTNVASLGTTTTLLHGNASGAPTFGAVALGTDVSGTLPFGSGGTGLGTAADDTTLVSSGSAWVAKALPTCTDTGGNHLNYDTSTNTFSCGTTSGITGTGANPTAVVGATAVNGSATTYMRSDAAPAIDLTMSPTWTGTHTFGNTTIFTALGSGATSAVLSSSANPSIGFKETDQATDTKNWDLFVNGHTLSLRTVNDAITATQNAFVVTRTATGTNVTDFSIGNTNNNNTFHVLGTGAATFGGTVTITNITTGTNADFVCTTSAFTLVIQSSACTISSLRFKENVLPFEDDALGLLGQLDVRTFNMKAQDNHDPNYRSKQIGLIAENVAKVAPLCAVYEDDMKTPKSYRQECVIALLTRSTQQLNAKAERQQIEIALLATWCLALTTLIAARRKVN